MMQDQIPAPFWPNLMCPPSCFYTQCFRCSLTVSYKFERSVSHLAHLSSATLTPLCPHPHATTTTDGSVPVMEAIGKRPLQLIQLIDVPSDQAWQLHHSLDKERKKCTTSRLCFSSCIDKLYNYIYIYIKLAVWTIISLFQKLVMLLKVNEALCNSAGVHTCILDYQWQKWVCKWNGNASSSQSTKTSHPPSP